MTEFKTDSKPAHTIEEPRPLSELVIQRVADAKDTDPLSLPPLQNAIDADALNSLFRPQLRPSSEPPQGKIKFHYHGYTVEVTAAGRVTLNETEPAEEDHEPFAHP